MKPIRQIQSALKRKVSPPEAPIAAKGDWDKVEKRLKLRLPSDYKWFIDNYGMGWLCDNVFVTSPFWKDSSGQNALAAVHETVKKIFERYVSIGFWKELPYPMYPQEGGLLMFAFTHVNEYLGWLTHGPPSRWRIIIFERLEICDSGYTSLIRLLFDALEGQAQLPEPFQFGYWMHSDPSFEPKELHSEG